MNKFSYPKRSRLKYEADLVDCLYIFGFSILAVFGCLYYITNAYLSVYINLFAFLILAISLFLFKHTKKQHLAKSLILATLLLLHITALIHGSYANSSFFWFFIFPLVALFLFKKKVAYIWIGILFSCIVISMILIRFGIVNVSYDANLLYTLLLALTVEVYIVNFTQGILLRYKEDLEKLNTGLLTTNILVDKYFLILRTDLEGNIIDANEAFLSVSLYSKEDLLGFPLTKFCSKHADASLEEEYFSNAKEDDCFNAVVECVKENGTSYWVDTRMVPEFDINQKQIGFLIFQQDVTQRVELEKASITDRLTKVNNRMHFDELSRHRLSEFERYGIISSLIICDIDNFKEINDNYGHLKGDEVLIEVAKLLQSHIRECDILSRWGGEEFAILLPQTDIENAFSVSEKIRDEIEAFDFGLEQKLTASFGVAMTVEDDSQSSWFSRADKALYRAKKSGRNLVCSS